MDWIGKQATAKKLLDKFGVAMSVVQYNHGAYISATDSYGSTAVTYDTIGVIVNPELAATRKATMASPGEYSKSDKVRVLLNGSALPTLDAIDFKVIYGSTTWTPVVVKVVRPGGVAILYLVDME